MKFLAMKSLCSGSTLNCRSHITHMDPIGLFLNIFFFGKRFKKKLLNIFSNFSFYLKIQSFRLIMENNFIQMAASAGHAVTYMINPIFRHIIDYVQLYFTNGPILPLHQNPQLTVTRFGCVGFSMYACGFSVLQMRQFTCLHTRQNQNVLHLKRWFFFFQNRHLP